MLRKSRWSRRTTPAHRSPLTRVAATVRHAVDAAIGVLVVIGLTAGFPRGGPDLSAEAALGDLQAAAVVRDTAERAVALYDAAPALLARAHAGAQELTTRLKRGDALVDALVRTGVERRDASNAALAMTSVFDSRTLMVGQAVTLYVRDTASGAHQLMGLALSPEPARTIHLTRQSDGAFRARALETPLTRRVTHVEGSVSQSLYADAKAAGAHDKTIAEIADILAYTVDFQREIRAGDQFEILFEEWVDPSGAPIKAGELYYVRFTPAGRSLAFWRFQPEGEDEVGFYDAQGRTAKRFLMKTPINGARLSSHFGKRRHPVLGYTRMHKGTDFAAPRGTPIYAAGDGVIERANRYGSFGNYVRIRHADGYETAYAHLHNFHSRTKAGRRVKQGQVIGYVGTTGRSTGPHLHYEVTKNGVHLNPMRLKAPLGRALEPSDRAAFDVERAYLDALRAKAKTGDVPAPAEADTLVVASR